MARVMRGQPLVTGEAAGAALVASEPLSFWGGYDYRSGEIIDRRHPLSGVVSAGRILALPHARGSSTTTAVLLEAVRAGTAPAAMLTSGPDTFFALAAIVAGEMYGRWFPVAQLSPEDFARLRTGMHVAVAGDGTITLTDAEQEDR